MADQIKCGRRAVVLDGHTRLMTSCQLDYGHPASIDHDDGLGHSWPDRVTSPHLWVSPDAMGWGP